MTFQKPGKQALYEALLAKAKLWPREYLNSNAAFRELRADAAKHAPDGLGQGDLDQAASKALRVARGGHARAGRPSDKGQRILDFVRQYIAERGHAPSIREIMAGVGIRSSSTVAYHLGALEKAGKITRDEGQPRSIRITSGPRVVAMVEPPNEAGWARVMLLMTGSQGPPEWTREGQYSMGTFSFHVEDQGAVLGALRAAGWVE